jgi:tetratricopeptide (TPR) repeat protein
MLVRSGFITVVAASSLLVAGCQTRSSAARDPLQSPAALSSGQAGRLAAEQDLIEAHAHYAQAVIHELNDEPALALKEYTEAARADLGNEALTLEVSRRLLQAKQPEQALALLSRATARPDASGALFAQMGFVYSRLGRTELAISTSRVAIKKQPASLDGYRNLFVTYLQNQKAAEALAVLDEAAKVTPAGADFLIGVAELYGNFSLQIPAQREVARARGLEVLQRASALKVTDTQLRLRMADAYNLLGKDEEAARLYQDLLKRMPDLPFVRDGVRAKLADIYGRDRDPKRAAELIESIIRDNPTDTQAYYLLGRLKYDANDFARATECFSKVLLLEPEFEDAYYELAAAQLSQEKGAEALGTLEKARLKFAQNFMMENLTGMACNLQKDYTNAVRHFTTAEIIAGATDSRRLTETFYFQLGAACERAGDFERSEKYFEKCLTLAPNYAEAQNYLGYMWAERGEKLERAKELIEKALKTEPKNAAYLDSMGWVLFRLQQPKEALGYLLDAIKQSEEKDATLYDHLGDVYAALQDPDKAREAWRESLAVEPSETVRKKLDALPAR